MELIEQDLAGWVPGTNLYRDAGGQHYIISVVQYFTAHHTEIYLAGVEITPVMGTVWNDPADYFNKHPDDITADDFHVEQVAEHLEYFAVDADGDPLNGLTPLVVLPGGTTHEDAIAYLSEQETP